MILYFSGTGNSLSVAEKLGELLDEQIYSMEGNTCDLPAMSDGEALGIVFPVYAWGLPDIVVRFLGKVNTANRYVWTVMTCGDDMGYADRVLEGILDRKVDAAYSVQMPNTYVCLPGFDVDSDELAQRKQKETADRLPLIAAHVKARETRRELTRGGMAWIKTYVLRLLFNRYLVTDKYFHTNADCNFCGLCAKQCPVNDIALNSGHPVWKRQGCTGCLRCYHNCPKRAIEWGSFTKGKGQKK